MRLLIISAAFLFAGSVFAETKTAKEESSFLSLSAKTSESVTAELEKKIEEQVDVYVKQKMEEFLSIKKHKKPTKKPIVSSLDV